MRRQRGSTLLWRAGTVVAHDRSAARRHIGRLLWIGGPRSSILTPSYRIGNEDCKHIRNEGCSMGTRLCL